MPFFLHALELHGKGVFRVDAGRDGYGAHAPGHAERRGACFGAEMPAVEQDVPNRQRLKIVGPCPQAATASMPRDVYGFLRADCVVDMLPPAVFPAGDGVGQRGIHGLATSAEGTKASLSPLFRMRSGSA